MFENVDVNEVLKIMKNKGKENCQGIRGVGVELELGVCFVVAKELEDAQKSRNFGRMGSVQVSSSRNHNAECHFCSIN